MEEQTHTQVLANMIGTDVGPYKRTNASQCKAGCGWAFWFFRKCSCGAWQNSLVPNLEVLY
jgi:hypothetical protein